MPTKRWTSRVSQWWRGFTTVPQPKVEPLDCPHAERSGGVRWSQAVQVVSTDIPGLQAVTKDLSEQGLRLASTKELEIGQSIELNLLFSDSGIFPIRFLGECRWSRQPAQGPVELGIDLSRSNPRALAVLERFLKTQEDSDS